MVQQIAYSLAHANEYFNRMPNLNQPIVFQVSVGTNYFFEIAKLRTLRLLFNVIAKEYNIITTAIYWFRQQNATKHYTITM